MILQGHQVVLFFFLVYYQTENKCFKNAHPFLLKGLCAQTGIKQKFIIQKIREYLFSTKSYGMLIEKMNYVTELQRSDTFPCNLKSQEAIWFCVAPLELRFN
jgi:hypothetical protein